MSERIHLIRLVVENVHRIKAAAVELLPGGGVVRVTGKNRAGKSHVLRVVRELLGGAGEVLPDAIRDGAESGFARGELSNGFKIERVFTASAPKGRLKVTGPSGGKYGQAALDEWLGDAHDFDVLAFFDLPAKRQAEILLGLGKDPNLLAKVQGYRDRIGDLAAERTPILSLVQAAQRTPKPEGERPPDRKELVARRNELILAVDAWGQRERAYNALTEKIRWAEEESIPDIDRRIEELEAALAAAKSERASVANGLERAKERLPSMDPGPSPVDELKALDAELIEGNELRDQWDRYAATQAQREANEAAAAEITAMIRKLEAAVIEAIASAGIPIEGASVSPEGVPLLNGHELAVASGAERIRFAVEVAIAADPKLGIVFVDEGNDLDPEALAELDRLATEKGFQILLCRIGLEGPGEIVVEDGVATTGEQVTLRLPL